MSENEFEAQAVQGSVQWEGDLENHPHAATLREAKLTTKNYILWDWYYQPGMVVDTPRKRAGVRAMKQELIFNGFKQGILIEVQAWGDAVTNRTKEFQTAEGLQADGVIGRVTARHLFHRRATVAAEQYGIPNELNARQKTWESANDPVCLGVTSDEGLVQIAPQYHPDITLAQMWDPAFCLPWQAGYLKGAFIYTGGDWDGAVAAYNVGGFTAKQWIAAGKPASGGPQLGSNLDGTPVYAWTRCTEYVANVKKSLA